jgi:UDP-N-acetylmuramoylalanine--D-glutamate ligase
VMLNISSDHLDRHATAAEYAAAKARIFENQDEGDWAVVNADDPYVLELAARSRARTRLFGRRAHVAEGTTIEGGWIVDRRGTSSSRLVPIDAVNLLGPHLVDDVLAAATVGVLMGAAPSALTDAVRGVRGLEHAMELAGEVEGVRFDNDSKATNVDAALKAIESFERNVVTILGGRFKGGDLGRLREPLRLRGRAVVAIGEAAPLVRGTFDGVLEVRDAATLEEAVTIGFDLAGPGGVVLLAPACASFDMFRDYAERGRRFKEAVAQLARRRGGFEDFEVHE